MMHNIPNTVGHRPCDKAARTDQRRHRCSSKKEITRKRIIASMMVLSFPGICFAGDCRIIQYPDHDEVICDTPQSEPLPLPAAKVKFPKQHADSKTPERKAAIRVLIKLSSQYDTGISFRNLIDLVSEAKTEISIYKNAVKNMGGADIALSDDMSVLLISYDQALLEWDLCIKYKMPKACDDYPQSLRNTTKKASEIVDFYNGIWE